MWFATEIFKIENREKWSRLNCSLEQGDAGIITEAVPGRCFPTNFIESSVT